MELRYYKNLTLVTELNQISDDKTYYIGRIENNVFYYMDLTSVGTTVPGTRAQGDITTAVDNPNQFVLSYTDTQKRATDTGYAIKIVKNENADTYQIYLTNNTAHKLGIRKSVIASTRIYCGTETSSWPFDYYYDFILSCDTSKNTWTFANEKAEQNIGYSNNSFSVSLFGSTSPEPIYIYQIDDDRDDVNTNPYSYVPTNQESAHHLPADQYVLYPQSESSASATKALRRLIR